MKKYIMWILTLLIVATTFTIYHWEASQASSIIDQEPSLSFHSEKYGEIMNITWSCSDEEHIFFLARPQNEIGNVVRLYVMNISNGEAKMLLEYPAHPSMPQFIQRARDPYHLHTVSSEGIYSVELDENYDLVNSDLLAIENFGKDLNSLYVDQNYVNYSKQNDRLLYVASRGKETNLDPFGYQPNLKFQNRWINPHKIIYSSSFFSRTVYYTKRGEGGLDLYKLEDRQENFKKELILENIITVTRNFVPAGILALQDQGDTYNIIFLEQSDGKKVLRTLAKDLSKQRNILGQTPHVVYTRGVLGYSQFEEDGKGAVIVYNRDGVGQKIIKDAPIVGPLRISREGKMLLYFIMENQEMKINIYNIEEDETINISNYFN